MRGWRASKAGRRVQNRHEDVADCDVRIGGWLHGWEGGPRLGLLCSRRDRLTFYEFPGTLRVDVELGSIIANEATPQSQRLWARVSGRRVHLTFEAMERGEENQKMAASAGLSPV